MQGETSAISEEGGLQPQKGHPLHALLRAHRSQPQRSLWTLPLVHVSTTAVWSHQVCVCVFVFGLFVCVLREQKCVLIALFFSKVVCQNIYSIIFKWFTSRGLPFIPHLDSLPNFNRSVDGPVRLPIVDKYKVSWSYPGSPAYYCNVLLKGLVIFLFTAAAQMCALKGPEGQSVQSCQRFV